MTVFFSLKPRTLLSDPASKRELNKTLFEVVAPGYDRITRRLSFNRDHRWKDSLIALLPRKRHPVCVDLACGTGDLMKRLAARYPDASILGIDITPAMIAQAGTVRASARCRFKVGDMAATGLPAASVDIVTGGYALRNAGNLDEALAEIARILKPDGVAAFLDFSKPSFRPVQWLTAGLLRSWGGFWGWRVHRNPDVYGYIADSLNHYPDRRALTARLRAAGLHTQKRRLFFGGIIEARLVCRQQGVS